MTGKEFRTWLNNGTLSISQVARFLGRNQSTLHAWFKRGVPKGMELKLDKLRRFITHPILELECEECGHVMKLSYEDLKTWTVEMEDFLKTKTTVQ